jgi:hypothetical protein
MVRSLAVTFSGPVTLDAGAFTITPQAGGPAVPLMWTTALVGGVTVATITFPGGTGGSLDDGRWVLRTDATKVHDAAGAFMAADRADTFFRFYGDVTGDGVVNGADFASFRPAFGTTAGNPAYLSYLDYDGDGAVNGADFGFFRARFGTALP